MATAVLLISGAVLGADITVGPGGEDYTTITAAIANAANGDTIIVSEGTYNEIVDPMGLVVTIRSTDPTDESVVAATIIDPQGTGPAVRLSSGESYTTIVDGFTLTGGAGEPKFGQLYGGGVYAWDGVQAVVRNCVIRNNSSDVGGGVAALLASPRIIGCTIHDNDARDGGGVAVNNSSMRLIGSRVYDNDAQDGGGLSLHTWDGYAVNCLVFGNEGTERAGGIWAECGSSGLIVNTTVTQNMSPNGAAIYAEAVSSVRLANSIVWNNGDAASPDIEDSSDSTTVATHCIIEGGWPGDSIIDEDPDFNSPGTPTGPNAFRLMTGSPGRNAGDNTEIPAGIDEDIAGDARVQGDVVDLGPFEEAGAAPLAPEDTNQDGCVDTIDLVDTLAHWGPCSGCVWDIDETGAVAFGDVMRILLAWNP